MNIFFIALNSYCKFSGWRPKDKQYFDEPYPVSSRGN